jgi:hypothetical protein
MAEKGGRGSRPAQEKPKMGCGLRKNAKGEVYVISAT